MARKPYSANASAETAVNEEAVSETPEVIVAEQAPVEEERKLSAQTLAEMEAGRKSLEEHAKNP